MICDDDEEVDDCGRIGIWGGGIEVCGRRRDYSRSCPVKASTVLTSICGVA